MKRVDLIRTIEGFGCIFVRHGGKHDWYRNPFTGISQPIPRHREIKEGLARHIIKELSNPEGSSKSQATGKLPPNSATARDRRPFAVPAEHERSQSGRQPVTGGVRPHTVDS